MNETITIRDVCGDDFVLPARRVLCSRCNGDGKVDHSAFSNGITASEWSEWGDEDRGAYLSGVYDVKCPECEGRRWILEPDEEHMTDEEIKALDDHRRFEMEYEVERRAERRFGC